MGAEYETWYETARWVNMRKRTIYGAERTFRGDGDKPFCLAQYGVLHSFVVLCRVALVQHHETDKNALTSHE